MRVVLFGTYDVRRHPRIGVLAEGLRHRGVTVEECNHPLGVDTAARVVGVARPWRLVAPAFRMLGAWVDLWRCGRRMATPDAVVVGYLGSLDVHLARILWRRVPIVLDQLAFAGDTARDRRVGSRWMVRLLDGIDRRAAATADVVMVDTVENLGLIPGDLRHRGMVVPVGAPDAWFRSPQRHPEETLRVIFYGLYTPLQGAPVIAEAMARLGSADIEWTMVGTGQELDTARRIAAAVPRARWLDWVDAAELPTLVADHDVCLGIFGTGDKAQRVVPNKVYQGAAAGCAVVTSDTPPQRLAFGGAAVFVPAGDAAALADALHLLSTDRLLLDRMRAAAHAHADRRFRPEEVVTALVDRLRGADPDD